MPQKLNSFFKKKYTIKNFEKKLLNKVFITTDKDLILSIYEKKDNEYLLKPMPVADDKEIKKLNGLVSQIKKNSGALGIGKLGTAIVLVSFIVFFFVFLLNPLAHRGMTAGLEAIFGGETEIRGFRLSIFRGYIRYNTLQVADKNNLDRNLFQTGRAVIDLNMPEVLRGKFSVREIALEDFAVGTRRQTRARPLERRERERAQQQETVAELPDLREMAESFLPDNFIPDRDAVKKAITDNLNRLTTPVVIEENINAINAGVNTIRSNADQIGQNITTLSREVNEISNTRITSPTDVAGIAAARDRIQAANDSVNSINSGLNSTRNELRTIENIAAQSHRTIQNSISADIDFVTSLFPSIDSFRFSALVEPMIMEQLLPFIEQYGDAFTIVMALMESGRSGSAPEVQPSRQRGRNIRFRVFRTPSVHIERISGSFFTGRDRHALGINDITNDQQILGRPLTFLIDSSHRGISTNIDGLFDTRDTSANFSSIDVSVLGNRFSNASFLSAAGIDNFGADVDISGLSIISRDRDYRGTVGIALRNLQMEATNTAGRIIKNIIETGDQLTFDLTFRYANRRVSLSLQSNLDRLIADAISPEAIAAEIRIFAQDAISELIKDKADILSDAEQQINNLRAQMNDYENQLRAKQRELEESLRALPIPTPTDLIPAGVLPSVPAAPGVPGGIPSRIPGR
ncbi:MAG: hypothetical protein FWC36_06230 [Spirochaetes bacterium]|nr:hypothetical protein [Spirochaetota bacterium]